jgi:formylglycine-generating enzyme required for sulfatase activity
MVKTAMVVIAIMTEALCAAAGETVGRRDVTLDLGGGVTLELVWCPPGTFMMGSPEGEDGRNTDETRHRVTLTKGFWLGKTEVTQRQWEAVMGSNPSNFGDDDLPVESVSWDDCQAFCRRLNEKLTSPCFAKVTAGAGILSCFRIPTEAEWEYACRAGTETVFCYGDVLDATLASYNGHYPYGGAAKSVYRARTTTVGSFRPNAWGLYDMHGNVWEWCADRYGDYSEYGTTDLAGTAAGADRVIRGGSWSFFARGCRSAARCRIDPSGRRFDIGFRLAGGLP